MKGQASVGKLYEGAVTSGGRNCGNDVLRVHQFLTTVEQAVASPNGPLRARLEKLASEYLGEYDGWEEGVVQP
jgi:hypothetical protein